MKHANHISDRFWLAIHLPFYLATILGLLEITKSLIRGPFEDIHRGLVLCSPAIMFTTLIGIGQRFSLRSKPRAADAARSPRRPYCGLACPDYRLTCRHCKAQAGRDGHRLPPSEETKDV